MKTDISFVYDIIESEIHRLTMEPKELYDEGLISKAGSDLLFDKNLVALKSLNQTLHTIKQFVIDANKLVDEKTKN